MSFLAFRFHPCRKFKIRETPRIPEWARYPPDSDEGLRGCCRQCAPCAFDSFVPGAAAIVYLLLAFNSILTRFNSFRVELNLFLTRYYELKML